MGDTLKPGIAREAYFALHNHAPESEDQFCSYCSLERENAALLSSLKELVALRDWQHKGPEVQRAIEVIANVERKA